MAEALLLHPKGCRVLGVGWDDWLPCVPALLQFRDVYRNKEGSGEHSSSCSYKFWQGVPLEHFLPKQQRYVRYPLDQKQFYLCRRKLLTFRVLRSKSGQMLFLKLKIFLPPAVHPILLPGVTTESAEGNTCSTSTGKAQCPRIKRCGRRMSAGPV